AAISIGRQLCVRIISRAEREQGRRIKRNDYDYAGHKGLYIFSFAILSLFSYFFVDILRQQTTIQRIHHMEKPTPLENIKCWIGAGKGIFRSDNVPEEAVVNIVYCFHGQYIGTNTREFNMKFLLLITDVYPFVVVTDFFGALREQIYDDEVRKWVLGTGIEAIEVKLWNSREGPPTFDQQKLPLRSSFGMVTCLSKSKRML
ncbi:hypothetical protein H5410_015489, partial [Solanum commersonii]